MLVFAPLCSALSKELGLLKFAERLNLLSLAENVGTLLSLKILSEVLTNGSTPFLMLAGLGPSSLCKAKEALVPWAWQPWWLQAFRTAALRSTSSQVLHSKSHYMSCKESILRILTHFFHPIFVFKAILAT